MNRTIRALLTFALISIFVGAAAAASESEPDSRWPPEIAKVDELLRDGKWKRGARLAARTSHALVRDSWGPRESARWLGELSLYRAIGEANLGEREVAVWYWHVAQNLYPKIRSYDLSPYGSAASVLLEYPLRQRGKPPTGV